MKIKQTNKYNKNYIQLAFNFFIFQNSQKNNTLFKKILFTVIGINKTLYNQNFYNQLQHYLIYQWYLDMNVVTNIIERKFVTLQRMHFLDTKKFVFRMSVIISRKYVRYGFQHFWVLVFINTKQIRFRTGIHFPSIQFLV